MSKLPVAPGGKHIAAFKRDGWVVDRIEGSHHILIKEGYSYHLSIPVHKGKDIDTGLLKKLVRYAGLTNEEYIDLYFRGKRKR